MSWLSCGNSVDPVEIDDCLEGGTTTRQTQQKDFGTISHVKDITTSVVIGDTEIPVRNRTRNFNFNWSTGWRHDNAKVIVDSQFYEHECYTPVSLYASSVSENSTYTDGTIYIADTEHNNAFWKETKYSCVFSGASTDTTTFHHPTWVANKLRIHNVTYVIETTWKLMLNGKVETVLTESSVKPMYSPDRPLFFVYPMPMSGETADPDFLDVPQGGKGYSFLDYRTGGLGPSEAEIKSGGQDYYYPEYLWYMGDYREQDQYDAIERFNDTYGAYTNVKDKETRNVLMPIIHGPEDPRGSIIRDYAGNTFVSVTVSKQNGDLLHINKLIDKDGIAQVIPETLPGDNIRYYPVGLV